MGNSTLGIREVSMIHGTETSTSLDNVAVDGDPNRRVCGRSDGQTLERGVFFSIPFYVHLIAHCVSLVWC